MISETISIFSLDSGKYFGDLIAKHLNLPLTKHEEREFEDGEHKIRSLETVRGKDVFIIQSIYSEKGISVNDKLCKILFFIAALKESGAKKVTAVIPYLCYSRKDRKTKDRDPVTTKYIAKLFEASGLDHVIVMDVHNLQAYQNSFRILNDHLEAKEIIADYIYDNYKHENLTIMSPDAGGMKRADSFRNSLEEKIGQKLEIIFMEKKRSRDIVSGSSLVGDVKDKTVIIIDDLISSGSTLLRSAVACKEAGANHVIAAATHAVLSKKAESNLNNSALDLIIITNTIPVHQQSIKNLAVLDTSQYLAKIINRLHFNESFLI